MNIKIGQIITLNGTEKYIVVSMVNYKNGVYLYLASPEKQKIGLLKKENGYLKVIEITDEHTIAKLILLFDKNLKNTLSD